MLTGGVKLADLHYNAPMMTSATTTTPLEHYFEFTYSPEDGEVQSIRIAGTRVGIEYIMREYLTGASPKELALRFPTVSLEQIHATITYYLAQRQQVTQYLQSVWQQQVRDSMDQQANSSSFVTGLRQKLSLARAELHNTGHLFGLAADYSDLKMPPRFLLDEHVNPAIQRQLHRLSREIEVRCIGEPDAPAKGTSDADVLIWAELKNCT